VANPDPKPTTRYRASQEEWEEFRERKLFGRPCRVCAGPAESLHHLVGRDLGGDDCFENLVPLCGDGVRGCHGAVQGLSRQHCSLLRAALHDEEVAYVVAEKSEAFLDRYYPAVLSESEAERSIGATGATSGSLSPGEKCPACERRVPHPRKESSPKQTRQLNLGPAPADFVEEVKTRLDDQAALWGLAAKPHHRYKVLDLALEFARAVNSEAALKVAEERPWAA
jgi:hypothetical protein